MGVTGCQKELKYRNTQTPDFWGAKGFGEGETLTSMNLQAAFGTGYQGTGSILSNVGIWRKGLGVLSTWGKAHLWDQGLGLLPTLGKVHKRGWLPCGGWGSFLLHLWGLQRKPHHWNILFLAMVLTFHSEHSPCKKGTPNSLKSWFPPLLLPLFLRHRLGSVISCGSSKKH